ncbi:FkbM family methyltransferase [Novipirellula maiorica]|uniref:FkbM family methyltransferase n=1 Tax=Novipirellula maiorica TaxID=1265734 RepID=UPI00034A359A|nr:FkbM family methyltransferase [Rhodopirellula maiorica]
MGAGTNGCWIGTYERDKQQVFTDAATAGATVFDVGANVGFYTLLAARCVGKDGFVHCFEPFPENLRTLRQHLELNPCQNVTVHEAAVSDRSGTYRFASGDCPETGKLDEHGDVEVQVIQIDEETSSGRIPYPDVVKIDVEGAESKVLLGARETLLSRQPILLVAIHGSSMLREVQAIIKDFRYEVEVESSKAPGMYEIYARPQKHRPSTMSPLTTDVQRR